MESGSDKELDRLLRRHALLATALRTSGSIGDSVSFTAADHLLPDEIAAYATGALAPVSRRYYTHLSNCDECRNLVSALVLSRTTPDQELSNKKSYFFTAWLEPFFTRHLLLYGVPALAGLLIVAVLFLISIKQKRTETLVAQTNGTDLQPGFNQVSPETVRPSANGQISLNGTEDRPAPEASARSEPSDRKKIAVTGPGATTKSETSRPQTVPNSVNGFFVPGAHAPEAKPLSSENQSMTNPREEAAGAIAQNRSEMPEMPSPAAKESTGRESRMSPGSVAAEHPAATMAQRARARSTAPDSPGTTASQLTSAERSVAGHVFIRRGELWVDSAYHPGQAITLLRRGSAQFSALTDENSSLAKIAEQLKGEILVVIQGQAYRIQ